MRQRDTTPPPTGSGEGKIDQGGRGRTQGGERPMGATAYGGKGSKGRAVGRDRPIGAVSCTPKHTMASCQTSSTATIWRRLHGTQASASNRKHQPAIQLGVVVPPPPPKSPHAWSPVLRALHLHRRQLLSVARAGKDPDAQEQKRVAQEEEARRQREYEEAKFMAFGHGRDENGVTYAPQRSPHLDGMSRLRSPRRLEGRW